MTQLARVRSRWQGFNGAPGYTVLHFRDFGAGDGGGGDVDAAMALGAVTRTFDFMRAFPALLPAVVNIQVEGTVDVIEDTTGELVNSFNVAPPAAVQGTAASNYSAASGAVVNWRTGGIRNGRRIRGRSFIVPLAIGAYSLSGQLSPASQTTLQNAATALANAALTPDLMVYARPTSAGAVDGTAAVVTSAQVPTLGAILRSRRD